MDIRHFGLVYAGYAAAILAAVFGMVALLIKSEGAVRSARNGVLALYLALSIGLLASILNRLI